VSSQDCSNCFLPGIGSQQTTLENKVQLAKNKRTKIAQQEAMLQDEIEYAQMMMNDILEGVDMEVL
jgi:hypothetical protein